MEIEFTATNDTKTFFREQETSRVNYKLITQCILIQLICLVAFLTYQAYARKYEIPLNVGCEGPALPFGMINGILLALVLRSSK
ncbi:hypothetical protein CIK05_10835 [Bdellovibrio sp. qaytius]|nr:hypothetical protein CIK05_10835 [Bdellovibrio sp. qaytius]